jgi:hypothetical protein
MIDGLSSDLIEDSENRVHSHVLVLEYVVVSLVGGDPLEELINKLIADLQQRLEGFEEISTVRHLVPHREAILFNN